MESKIKLNQIVMVKGEKGQVVCIEMFDRELDYLIVPVEDTVDFCKECGGGKLNPECGGSNWFRREDITTAVIS